MKRNSGRQRMGAIRRLIIGGSLVLLLAGCDTLFGEGAFFGNAPPPPLPGKRISVLLAQAALEPDPTTAGKEILLPPPTPNPDWPQAGGYANHAMYHIEVGDRLAPAWSNSIGHGSTDDERLIVQPIVAEGHVFAMDPENNISAFDAKTGAEIWSVDVTPEDEDDGHFGGGIGYEFGRIIATTGFGQVIALDAKNGNILWRRDFNTPFRTAPTLRGGRVFAVSVINQLEVLAADDGRTLWTHSGIEETASILGGASPAVDGNVVVVAYSSGELFALRVENGRELWSTSLTTQRRSNVVTTLSAIRGRPIIDRGIVIAISNAGLIAGIDLRTGRRIWEREIGGMESPWVAGDYIFLLSNSSDLLALGRTTGRIYWVTSLPQWEDPEDRVKRILWTGPILASDRLILAGSNGEALSVSPYTGKILGSEAMPDRVSVAPIVADRSIYFLSDDAELVAYR